MARKLHTFPDLVLDRQIRELCDEINSVFTPEGGLCVKLKAGEALVRGELVCIAQNGANMTIYKTPANTGTNPPYSATREENDTPFGTVYDVKAAAGDWVRVTVSGIGYVLPEAATTAARGYVVYVSGTEKGRAAQAANIGAAQHWREIGHFVSTGTGAGAATLAVLHFN